MKRIASVLGSLGSVSAAVLLLAGCATGGLPGNARLVGGGLNINWKAPTAGTAIVKEMSSGNVLLTKSLDEDDEIEFELEPDAANLLLGTNGISRAKVQLYFAPAPKKKE